MWISAFAPSLFSKHFQIQAIFRQAFPKIPLAVLWDSKGLRQLGGRVLARGDANKKQTASRLFPCHFPSWPGYALGYAGDDAGAADFASPVSSKRTGRRPVTNSQ
jgi:hypothetical protein